MITDEILNKYEMTVGIECHVQLATKTKLFSGADNDARDKEPNSVISPIDYALPGMLPVLNRRAVELAVIAGKALNSEIAKVSRFDRKHYFYPDLPKGYQISQMYEPIIGAGFIEAPLEDGSVVKVRIHHAHLEEDAGKLVHENDYSLVDLNRAGTPLIEIVSQPDIHSAKEARAYASELYRLMTFSGVTHGDLYHGNMRFDVNISVAKKGSDELGTRAEVKNLNSFKSVERATDYEFKRQVELIERGEKVVQETRGWNEDKQKTTSQRSKENAQDYRYMPDADIPPVVLSDEEISEIQATSPKLPNEYRKEWMDAGFDAKMIHALLLSQDRASLIDRILGKSNYETARRVGFWFLKTANNTDDDAEVSDKSVADEYFIKLSDMIKEGKLNSNAGDAVFAEMMKTSEDPEEIAEKLNLIQNNNTEELTAIVDEVLAEDQCQQAVNDIKNGNFKAIGFLVGQIMKKTAGKANPAVVQQIIKDRVGKNEATN